MASTKSRNGGTGVAAQYKLDPPSRYADDFARTNKFPVSNDDTAFAFNVRLNGENDKYFRFAFPMAESSNLSTFFGDDWKDVQAWLADLNRQIAEIPMPGFLTREKVTGFEILNLLLLLPGVCCLGGLCILLKNDAVVMSEVVESINAAAAKLAKGCYTVILVYARDFKDKEHMWLEFAKV